jgi:predicted phage terminase large subunit-like protein
MIFSSDALLDIPTKVVPNSALWPQKQDISKLDIIERGDKYTFSSQYQQDPRPIGGGMFKDSYWRYYDILPSDVYCYRIYGDTAQKTREHNDYSVFQLWAKSATQGIFLVDQCRGKWEAPELESKLVEFWNKHKPSQFKPMGAQLVKIEDKSSGSSLIQSIKKNYFIPVEPIQRNTDKVLRAMGVVRYFAAGFIHLPTDSDFVYDYKDEFGKFSPMMTHKHDDQIDPTMDAVEDLIVFEEMLYNNSNE